MVESKQRSFVRILRDHFDRLRIHQQRHHRVHQVMRDEFSRRRDEFVELAVLGLLKTQRFRSARNGNRVDTAAELQEALFFLLQGSRRPYARLNPEIYRQQDKEDDRVEDCGTRSHAKNLLRTMTVIAIRNRIAGSRTDPKNSM